MTKDSYHGISESYDQRLLVTVGGSLAHIRAPGQTLEPNSLPDHRSVFIVFCVAQEF